eukprot:570649-Rhodomonas_salina.1
MAHQSKSGAPVLPRTAALLRRHVTVLSGADDSHWWRCERFPNFGVVSPPARPAGAVAAGRALPAPSVTMTGTCRIWSRIFCCSGVHLSDD